MVLILTCHIQLLEDCIYIVIISYKVLKYSPPLVECHNIFGQQRNHLRTAHFILFNNNNIFIYKSRQQKAELIKVEPRKYVILIGCNI